MSQLWILWALIGWGLSQSIIIKLTLPDPPPDPVSWFVRSIAGILGGVAGASLVASTPMPGAALLGAVSGALVVVSAVRAFTKSG
ncbi:MAG TPA: hypothetical protein VLW26_01365 [Steroidobacteraceae bacterium]|nr:hypothetical protein [Steroidobacteraceae bacterium]